MHSFYRVLCSLLVVLSIVMFSSCCGTTDPYPKKKVNVFKKAATTENVQSSTKATQQR
jgi:hypothetical protein